MPEIDALPGRETHADNRPDSNMTHDSKAAAGPGAGNCVF
jgi:hypothetical protein